VFLEAYRRKKHWHVEKGEREKKVKKKKRKTNQNNCLREGGENLS